MYRRVFALAVALALGAADAMAQDRTFELRVSHFLPPSHPLHKALEDWGGSAEKASNGTITYKIYPAQQLGRAFDQYDMARDRIADVSLALNLELEGKRLELLKVLIPQLSRVGMLANAANPLLDVYLKSLRPAADVLGARYFRDSPHGRNRRRLAQARPSPSRSRRGRRRHVASQ